MVGRFNGMLYLSAKHTRSLVWWENPYKRCFGKPFESAVRTITKGTFALLLQSGLNEILWTDSMEYNLRNIQDLLSDGKTSCEKRFYELFREQIIPFGSLYECHSRSTKDKSRIHKFCKTVLSDIFIGNVLYVGWIWMERKRYGCGSWGAGKSWTHQKCTRKDSMRKRRQRLKVVQIHIPNRRWNSEAFWVRSGIENIHLDTGCSKFDDIYPEDMEFKDISRIHGGSWIFQQSQSCLAKRQTADTERPVARKLIVKQNLRACWKQMNPRDCVWKDFERKNHEDHVTGKRSTWELTKVKNQTEVIDDVKNKDITVQFTSVKDVCQLEKAEWETKHQKYKGRIVLRAGIEKDDSDSYAIFTEQGSSPSQMTAEKVMDIISRLPGCARQAAEDSS